jgi:hypothetical protein
VLGGLHLGQRSARRLDQSLQPQRRGPCHRRFQQRRIRRYRDGLELQRGARDAATWVFIAHPHPTDFLFWIWDNVPRNNGTLAVEINSGNSNRWAAFDLMGSHGLVDNSFASGRVNRDGIGAILRFTPQGGQPTMVPIMGGSGYASQGSLRAQVGLGNAIRGTAEVLWPGGVKNRLYNVFATERVLLPEIPCSYDSTMSRKSYVKCVTASLSDLLQVHGGPLNVLEAARLELSALRAYDESH